MSFIKKHKFIFLLIVAVIVAGGYYGYKKMTAITSQTSYILETVAKGTIITSVSGSGQVSASSQVDINPEVETTLTAVNIKLSQKVKEGDVLFNLDSEDLGKELRDARANLKSAELSLEKLKRGTREEALQSSYQKIDDAKADIIDAQADLVEVKANAEEDLADVYDDIESVMNDVYTKSDDIVNRQVRDFFVSNSYAPQLSFTTSANAGGEVIWLRESAQEAVQKIKDLVDNLSTSQAKLDETLNAANTQLAAIKNFVEKLNETIGGGIATASVSQTTLNSYKSVASTARTNINTAITNIDNQKKAIINQRKTNQDNIEAAKEKIADAQKAEKDAEDDLALQKLAADPLEIKAQEMNIQQKKNALADVQEKFENYTIKAPFDGIVAALKVEKGDTVEPSTVMATVITESQIAEITLNEVDVAKVKIDQKATLTFDAVDGLSIVGKVVEVDTIGTESQGVVSYGVKIAFDTQNDQVKPSMSVSASIITEAKSDIILVSNGALKNSGDAYYVEMIDQPVETGASNGSVTSLVTPRQQVITIGISDDTSTEITSGLNEGDRVVSQTATVATASKSSSDSSTTKSDTKSILGGSMSGPGAGGPPQ